jgi:hypothetical protein
MTMTHTDLKQAILGCIRQLYKMEFIGEIKIEDLDPVGYKVSLNLDRSENPLVLIADLPDEEFLDFIREEIRSRKLHKVKHYLATKVPGNTINICNERERTCRQNERSHCGTCV